MSLARAAIVTAARGWIGTPYLHQASLKGVGCDCLGLLRGVFRDVAGEEPAKITPYAQDWALWTRDEPLLAGLERLAPRARGAIGAGDVLVFRWRDGLPASHLGLAASSDTMIHAHDGAQVAEAPLHPGWRRRIAGVFVFPGVVD